MGLQMPLNTKPRELVFDLETSGHIMFGFGVGKQHVSYLQLLTDCKIVCICYRWRDEPLDVYHELHWSTKQCDKQMLKKFIKVAEQADVIIGQNHERFDIRWVNQRIAYHQLDKQLPIIVADDLYRLVKRKLYLPCYKLDYMAKYFGFGEKAPHELKLWIDVVYRNDRKVLTKEMIPYCGQDVILTDKIFTHLEPYLNRKIIGSVWHEDYAHCRQVNCDGRLVVGSHRICANLQKKTQYRCNKCGKYVTLGYNELKNTAGMAR